MRHICPLCTLCSRPNTCIAPRSMQYFALGNKPGLRACIPAHRNSKIEYYRTRAHFLNFKHGKRMITTTQAYNNLRFEHKSGYDERSRFCSYGTGQGITPSQAHPGVNLWNTGPSNCLRLCIPPVYLFIISKLDTHASLVRHRPSLGVLAYPPKPRSDLHARCHLCRARCGAQ